MNCPKCGNTLNEEAVFCPKCGEKVIVTEGIKNAASVKKDDTASGWKWIIVALFFAIGIFHSRSCFIYLGYFIDGYSVFDFSEFALAFWFLINALAIGIGNRKTMLSTFIISGIVMLVWFFNGFGVYSDFFHHLFDYKEGLISSIIFSGAGNLIAIPFGVLASALFIVKILNTKLPVAVLFIVSIIWTMSQFLLPIVIGYLDVPWKIGLSLVFLVSTVALLMLAIGLDKQKI